MPTPIVYVDEHGQPVSLDKLIKKDMLTMATATIEYEHHEIHSGESYSAHFDNTTANTDDHRSAIGFRTPDSVMVMHIVMEIASSSPAEFFLEELPTIDDDTGTEHTIYNRNRNSSKTSRTRSLQTTPVEGQVTTFIEAQIAAANFVAGTVVDHVQLVGGNGPKAVGGDGRGAQEWNLKRNTKYLLRMQNIGANTNLHEIHIDWYEHGEPDVD